MRKNKNRSGSTSIQRVSKQNGRYKVVKSFGSGNTEEEIESLYQKAEYYLQEKNNTLSLFVSKDDILLESYLQTLSNQQRIEEISFSYIKKILDNTIEIVFYDMTTLHFEASDEDDLRRTGFSLVGKHLRSQYAHTNA